MKGFFHRLLHTPPKPVGNRALLLLLGVGMALCGGIIGVASYFVGFMIFPFIGFAVAISTSIKAGPGATEAEPSSDG